MFFRDLLSAVSPAAVAVCPHKPAGSCVAAGSAGLLLRTCPSPLAWREGDAEMVDRTRAAPDNSLHQPSPATQLSWKSPLLIFSAPGQRWYLGYPPSTSRAPCSDPATGVTITEMTANILCNFCLNQDIVGCNAISFITHHVFVCGLVHPIQDFFWPARGPPSSSGSWPGIKPCSSSGQAVVTRHRHSHHPP